jgi:hypothetical protein
MFKIQKLSWWIEAVGPNQNDTNIHNFLHIPHDHVSFMYDIQFQTFKK